MLTLYCRSTVAFPAVTVCNMNKLKRSKLTGTKYQNLTSVSLGDMPTEYDRDKERSTFLQQIRDELVQHPDLTTKARQLMAQFQLNFLTVEEFLYRIVSVYGYSQIDYKKILMMANTRDLSDIMYRLTPTAEELSHYGHLISDFIIQCSYNHEDCHM